MNVISVVRAIAIVFFHSSAALAADPKCRLSIGSVLLDEALPEVGRQCGVQILYFSDVTVGKTAPQLNGEYTVGDALRRLLDPADLTFRRVNAMTIEIRQADPLRSRAARVAHAGVGTAPELEEVVINGTAEGLVATRIETPLRDIPQTLSIISGEQIRQQNNQTIVDAMRNTVGIVSEQRDSTVRYLYARGFNVPSYALDGGGGLRSTIQTPYAPALLLTPDISEFDHIEVLRGSNALFGADGSPGAAINLVRKRPLHQATAMFSASAGSWNNYRQELDVTGPVALDGALRGRLAASNARQNYFYDDAQAASKSVYAVFDYDLTDTTVLTAGGSYSKGRSRPFEIGLKFFTDGTDPGFPRNTSHTFDWNRFDTRVAESFLRLEQGVGENTRLRLNATYFDNSVTYLFGYISGTLNPVTRRAGRAGGQFTLEPSTQTQLNLEATLTGNSEWWNRRVEWVLGGDYVRAKSHTLSGQFGALGPVIDPDHFDPSLYPSPYTTFRRPPSVATLELSTFQEHEFRISGIFASLRVAITDPWSATAGLRVSDERAVDDHTYFWSGVGTPIYVVSEYDRVLTPYFGSLFQLDDNWSLYASYAEIFKAPLSNLESDLSGMPAMKGATLEGGIKGVWRDGTLNGSLGVFKIEQRNVPVKDTPTQDLRLGNGTFLPGCCWTPNGRNVSKGVDLELRGHLTARWLIGGGYTFNQSRQIVPGTPSGGPLSASTPRHLLRVWTDYRLPGALQRWSVGTTLNAQSAIKLSTLKFSQASYAVVSPRAGYNLDGHWQIGLTVNNVLDRTYYETFTGPGQNWYGEPRNYMVRLDARF